MKTYCIFSAGYLPQLGGVERYTYNLAKELSRRNKVIIITSYLGCGLFHENRKEAEVFRLPSYRLLDGRFPVMRYCRKTKRIFEKIRNIPIDYIIINTRFYPLSCVGAWFAKRNKIPSIVIEHGTGHFTVDNKILDCAGHIYEHFITCLLRKEVHNFYGVSFACNKWLRHFGIAAKGVLYNAVDEKQIMDLCMIENKEIQRRICYKDSDFVITYTGRIIKEKGILKLISAFQKVKKKHSNVKLCIAGNGELYEEILKRNENGTSNGIFLLGKLSFQDVIGLLRITDIFCLPTEYPEGFSTSVLEAAACRTYVITTNSGGAKELISNESFGVILQRNDADEIAEKIIYAIEHQKIRENAAERAYNRAVRKFTWSHTAGMVEDLFKAGSAEYV